MADAPALRILIPIFPGLTALDAIGPHEVLSRLPGATVELVAASCAPVRAGGGLTVQPNATFAERGRADVLVVPGGPGVPLDDAALLGWLAAIDATTRLTASVCTGALLLAAAGVLRGVEATTHWRAMDKLAALGAVPVRERVVERGRIITCAGVSAGIDGALAIAATLADPTTAHAIQLQLEYDPRPPFAGDVATAPAAVRERNLALFPSR